MYKKVANLQIKSLIKGSQLSHNRIKDLVLEAKCLVLGEYNSTWSNWNTTKFSTFMDVLDLSKDHLATVEIVLPYFDFFSSRVAHDGNFLEGSQIVCNVLDSLKEFHCLWKVTIIASTLMDLKYESDDKTLLIMDNHEQVDTVSQSSDGATTLLKGILGFFEGSFTSFIHLCFNSFKIPHQL